MSWFGFSSAAADPAAEEYKTVSKKPLSSNTLYAEQTIAGLSAEQIAQVEAKVKDLRDSLFSDESEWEPFYAEKGVKGIRQFVDGRDVARIRSEIYMPFHILDIFEFFYKPENLPKMDSIVNTLEYFKTYSPHSWAGCTMLHGQWPVISPREFIDLFHWRLLDDGSVLFFYFSVEMDEKPVTEEAVRGMDYLKGFLLRPTDDGAGTDVHMIFDSDPRGDFPAMLVNTAMTNQPTGLLTAHNVLLERADKGELRDTTLPGRYEDFLAVVKKA